MGILFWDMRDLWDSGDVCVCGLLLRWCAVMGGRGVILRWTAVIIGGEFMT